MRKKKFYGSLVRRIVLIFLLLVIFPLGVHAFLVWDRDHKEQIGNAFSDLKLLAKANEEIFEGWFNHGLDLLETIAYLTDDEFDLTDRFKDADSYGNFSSLFTLDAHFETDCTTEGEIILPKPILEIAYAKGQLAFLEKNRQTHREEIYLVKKIDGLLWGLSVDAEEWLKKNGIRLEFVDSAKRMDEHLRVFRQDQLENWENEFTLSEIIQLKGKDLAIRIVLPDVLFDLQVQLNAEDVAAYKRINFLNYMIGLFTLLFVFGGIFAWWLIYRMSKPLTHLNEVMDAVASGDMNHRYKKQSYGFEINALGEQFNQMLSSLFLHMEVAKKEKISREILSKELEIGREVQDHLLPTTIPEFPGLSIGCGFVPAKELGGDFYDLFAKDPNQLFLAMADASDKGVSACLYSLIVRSLFRGEILSKDSLDEVIRHVNKLFCQDTKSTGEFVTAWIGIYHADKHLLTYSNLGHLPGILCHPDGRIEELTTEGIALGVMKDLQVEIQTQTLPPNSMLLLYTDGITEAQNEKGELFEKSRLLEFAKSHCTLDPQDLIDHLIRVINEFSNGVPQHDDITILCLKVN